MMMISFLKTNKFIIYYFKNSQIIPTYNELISASLKLRFP